MDSMEINKAFAAVLTAGIAFMVFGLVAETAVHPHPLKESVLKIEGVGAEAAAPGPKAPVVPIAALLQTADPAAGEATTKKLCVSCHSFVEGGKAGVGPNLYNTVGNVHGHMEGYQYSAALKSKEGPWTFDELNEWLTSPRSYAPGTKMAFAGIGNDKQRADVIDYLRTLSKNPVPLPPAPAAAPAATPAAAPAAAAAPGAAPAATPVNPAPNAAAPSVSGGNRPPEPAASSNSAPGTAPGTVAKATDPVTSETQQATPSGANAPTEGVTRPQPAVTNNSGGSAGGQGGGMSQPTLNQNESQIQQNQAQQPSTTSGSIGGVTN